MIFVFIFSLFVSCLNEIYETNVSTVPAMCNKSILLLPKTESLKTRLDFMNHPIHKWTKTGNFLVKVLKSQLILLSTELPVPKD